VATHDDRLVLLAVAHDQVEASIWQDVLEPRDRRLRESRDALATFGVSPLPGTLEVYVQARDESAPLGAGREGRTSLN
jgi:hypothetical protein